MSSFRLSSSKSSYQSIPNHQHHKLPYPQTHPLSLKQILKSDPQSRKLAVMLSLTLAFFFVELIVGYVGGSLALVADAFHMLSDSLSLGIGMAARILATHPTTSKNSFGYKRAEVLAGNSNAVFLLTVCFFIIMDAITRLFESHGMEDPMLILIVAAVGLVMNIIGLFMFHSDVHHHSHSHSHHSQSTSIPSFNGSGSDPDLEPLSNSSRSFDHGHSHSHTNSNIHGVYLH